MTSRRIWLIFWFVPVLLFRFFYGMVEGARGEINEFVGDWKAQWEKDAKR